MDTFWIEKCKLVECEKCGEYVTLDNQGNYEPHRIDPFSDWCVRPKIEQKKQCKKNNRSKVGSAAIDVSGFVKYLKPEFTKTIQLTLNL